MNNIGSGESYSVKYVVEMIQKILNLSIPIYSENIVRALEINNTLADIRLAKKELHWVPKYSLES